MSTPSKASMSSSKQQVDDMNEEKYLGRESKKSSVASIFRYADWVDLLLMFLGTLGAIGDGMSTNVLLVFASRLMNSLGYGNNNHDADYGNFKHEVEKCVLAFVYLALTVFTVAFLEGYCWSKTSERQVLKIRYKYLEALLRQEVGFFDSEEMTTSEIIDSISKGTSLIQEVLSEKVPIFLMHSSAFISGLAFAFYFSWRLSLVAMPLLTFLIIPGLLYGKFLMYLSQKSHREYSKANTIVEQALSSIRTVFAFTAEKRIVATYSAVLDRISKLGLAQGLAKGLAVGSTGLSFAIWAFMAWFGGRLVMFKGESGGRIYAAGISFILGGLALGMAIPEIKHFTEAATAAAAIFHSVDRVPLIDADDNTGRVLDHVCGEVRFETVRFAYPSRPDHPVLHDFNLVVPAGQTVALVGSSGSGKSTAVALLQRFYDADQGLVSIDGVDLRTLQLKWIRGKMGLVSQDHSLFGTSIKENIMFGKPDATMDEVVAAATTANAHSFIRQLPNGYETKVGERGGLLSGGQKQRIAIARAVIKNPAILLLDEATSALDSESEQLVQIALEQASMGRTTLVVAHKLSTVKNANEIAVMSVGRVVERGSHVQLIHRPNGHYARLVKLQRTLSTDDADPHSAPDTCASSAARSSAGRATTPASFPSTPHPADPPSSPLQLPSTAAPSFKRLLFLNAPEWKHAAAGGLSAATFGAVQPVYALTIGGMIAAFFSPTHDEMRARIRTYSFIFSGLAAVSIVLNLCQHYCFAYMGERLTRRIRVWMLEKILSFEAAWFDEEANSSGVLCSRLSHDAAMVKSLVADRVSLLVQTASAVSVAMVIGLVVAWKLALVMIAVQPLTILCFYTKKVLLSSLTVDLLKAQGRSTQVAAEAVCNHRVVSSFVCVGKVLEIFGDAQVEPKRAARKRAWLAGVGMGSAQSLTYLCWALDFWYGCRLVQSRDISAGDVFKTFFVLVSTGKVIADAGSMTSDLAKGAAAVASVFDILDRRSNMQVPDPSDLGREGGKAPSIQVTGGSKLERINGSVELKKVEFAYPSRPQTLVLKGFNLEVKAGRSVALVGRSGSGKSTVIGLLQRFYDVRLGSVCVDGVDIRQLDVAWYRGHMALVSQDPVIFSGRIRDNILYGKPEAAEEEVVEAAMAANAHGFISSMKDGYETECGERGVQLSGGQRQRIAIARAIIRKPTILLLDEATSALDVQSEQVVQEALDRIMVGRTTVVVAHRLNTIKHLDMIAYVAEGKVVEHGSYSQLKSKRGAFFSLASLQA